jgi:hypothetical protein
LSSRAGWLRERVAASVGRVAIALLLGASIFAAVPYLKAPLAAARSDAIELRAEPITGFDVRDGSRRHFGLLEFRGGLVLRSSDRNFGGLSAIRVASDGAHFIALTDRGWWLRGRIVYDGARPRDIADAEMAPILGPDGRPITARGWYDTEAIAEDGGTLYVAIERVHQIVRFSYGKEGLLARGRAIPVPPALRGLPSNRGLEAMVFVPKGLPLAGTLIAISERGLKGATDVSAFLIGGPSPGSFAVKRTADYDVSDAALVPGSDVLLLLERKFSWTSGLAVRIRRIALAAIKPDAVVDGPVLFEADLGYEIDNMEGLSVHRAGGEIVLTLVSDDNFAFFQRTLLLQFTLAEP